jgi:3-hydroxyisobutyrate dehydrogenase-like beta-hydroxyacid dehydrogenase
MPGLRQRHHLEQGKLSMMVGGEPGTFARVKPLLEDLATKVTYVGANGLACR